MKTLVCCALLALSGCATLPGQIRQSPYVDCLILPRLGKPYYDQCTSHVRPIDPDNEYIFLMLRSDLEISEQQE